VEGERFVKEGGPTMTNAEKFEEVFGIKIDENYPAPICKCIDIHICESSIDCSECPAFYFWEHEYKEVKP
jgi:hypothetical protein